MHRKSRNARIPNLSRVLATIFATLIVLVAVAGAPLPTQRSADALPGPVTTRSITPHPQTATGSGTQSRARVTRPAIRHPATRSSRPKASRARSATVSPPPASRPSTLAASLDTPPPGALRPAEFGAVGNGVTDDTAALQRALDSVPQGGTLWLPPGAVYAHSDVLQARVTGEHIIGRGTLLATAEGRSAFWITADDVTVEGVSFRVQRTTKRWNAYEQMGVRLAGVTGTVLRDITATGSAAAGIYVGHSCCTRPFKRSSNFLIEDVSVSNTRADGIHVTGGSYDGVIRRATVLHSGDDGVAVVSYAADGVICNHITIDSPTVIANLWGRGVSVVGGQYITYNDVHITASNAAAIYIANEGAPFYTASSEHIVINGGTLTDSNTDPAVGHGAILVWSAQAGYAVEDVRIDGITITRTRASAPWQVGVRTGGGAVAGIVLSNFTIAGAVRPLATNVSGSAYSTVNWVVNNAVQPNHL